MANIRCLWIGRDIPLPATTGERLYSLKLAESLALAGASVTYFGQSVVESHTAGFDAASVPSLTFKVVLAARLSYLRAAFSLLPLVAATYNSPAARSALMECLKFDWDAIIFDNYAAVWALPKLERAFKSRAKQPIIAYVSHNCESNLAHTLFLAYRGRFLRKCFLGFNYLKISFWERRLVGRSDILTAITYEDSAMLAAIPKSRRVNLVLTPGYEGPLRPMPALDGASDRRVVLVGSFKWIVKQQNLRELINAADELFYKNGIALDVVGEIPEELKRSFGDQLKATQFHGFVDDFHPLFMRARMAIVPEVVGGGFKLKILDYIFGGLPVATLQQAAAGLPESIKLTFIQSDSLHGLVGAVIANIDDLDRLRELRASAFEAARNEFNWRDRGRSLFNAIQGASA